MKELKGEFSSQNTEVELPQHLKQKIIDEILQRLVSLNSRSTNGSHSQVIAMERGEFMLIGCDNNSVLFRQ